MSAVDERIAEVFARPLEEFVDARNALAKELDEVSARRVRALRKPTVAAWAVNRVVAEHRRKVTALLEAGETLAGAQRKLMRGHRSDDLHDLMRAERESIAALTDDAATLLEASGHPATAQVREKIADTLAALATDEAVRDAALGGRLQKEARRVGFGMDEQEIGEIKPLPPRDDRGRKRLQEAEREAGRLAERRDELAAEARRLRVAAREAEDRASAAARRAAEAADKSEAAERALKELRKKSKR